MAGNTIVCIENMTNISLNNLEEELHSENSYYEESFEASQIEEVESVGCRVSYHRVLLNDGFEKRRT